MDNHLNSAAEERMKRALKSPMYQNAQKFMNSPAGKRQMKFMQSDAGKRMLKRMNDPRLQKSIQRFEKSSFSKQNWQIDSLVRQANNPQLKASIKRLEKIIGRPGAGITSKQAENLLKLQKSNLFNSTNVGIAKFNDADSGAIVTKQSETNSPTEKATDVDDDWNQIIVEAISYASTQAIANNITNGNEETQPANIDPETLTELQEFSPHVWSRVSNLWNSSLDTMDKIEILVDFIVLIKTIVDMVHP